MRDGLCCPSFFMSKYENELYHHGILGQKWGVRRFQNEDGSYTEAGKRRRNGNLRDFYSNNKDKIHDVGKKIAIAAVAGVSAYALIKNKEAVGNFLKKSGTVAVSTLSESMKRVGESMVDAALMSIGTVAISKLAANLPTDSSVDENTRYKNQILLDTATAGIKTATKANGSSNNASKNSGNIGSELTEKLGTPSKKGLDRQSNAYQNLFKDKNGNQRSSEVRSMIKSLASAGYDIDQLEAYVNGIDNGSIKHSIEDAGYCIVQSIIANDFILL